MHERRPARTQQAKGNANKPEKKAGTDKLVHEKGKNEEKSAKNRYDRKKVPNLTNLEKKCQKTAPYGREKVFLENEQNGQQKFRQPGTPKSQNSKNKSTSLKNQKAKTREADRTKSKNLEGEGIPSPTHAARSMT